MRLGRKNKLSVRGFFVWAVFIKSSSGPNLATSQSNTTGIVKCRETERPKSRHEWGWEGKRNWVWEGSLFELELDELTEVELELELDTLFSSSNSSSLSRARFCSRNCRRIEVGRRGILQHYIQNFSEILLINNGLPYNITILL